MKPLEISYGSSTSLKNDGGVSGRHVPLGGKQYQHDREVAGMIQVRAPCDMDSGYMFMADIISSRSGPLVDSTTITAMQPLGPIDPRKSSSSSRNHIKFLLQSQLQQQKQQQQPQQQQQQCWITVPPGGVKQGQVFWATPQSATACERTNTPFFFKNNVNTNNSSNEDRNDIHNYYNNNDSKNYINKNRFTTSMTNSYQNGPLGTIGRHDTNRMSQSLPLTTNYDEILSPADNGSCNWNDGLFDCFRFGLFHPTVLNSLFCPQILMGQILTRLNMTWLGDDNDENNNSNDNNWKNVNHNHSWSDDDNDDDNDNNYYNTKFSLGLFGRSVSNRWKQRTTFQKICIVVCFYWIVTFLLSPSTIQQQTPTNATVIMVPGGALSTTTTTTTPTQSTGPVITAAEPILFQQNHTSSSSSTITSSQQIRSFLYNAISWIFGLYTLIVLTKLRRSIRNRYSIRTSSLLSSDHCCGCCFRRSSSTTSSSSTNNRTSIPYYYQTRGSSDSNNNNTTATTNNQHSSKLYLFSSEDYNTDHSIHNNSIVDDNDDRIIIVEDCCISFWCGCCSVAQMARQTCNYEETNHDPSCCSSTGLVLSSSSSSSLASRMAPIPIYTSNVNTSSIDRGTNSTIDNNNNNINLNNNFNNNLNNLNSNHIVDLNINPNKKKPYAKSVYDSLNAIIDTIPTTPTPGSTIHQSSSDQEEREKENAAFVRVV